MTKRIDLNADLGEGCAFDAELMAVVTSCNIACGGHAGDDASMQVALNQAKQNNVAAGAHPSFPDRANFGRTKSSLSGADLEQELVRQIDQLKHHADHIGVQLHHVKPHGALYNMAAQDASLAQTVVASVRSTLPDAALFAPPNSELEAAARKHGLRFVAEGFADRAYEADGSLRDRSKPGAVLDSPDAQALQALQMVNEATVDAFDGAKVSLPITTICVHGDTPGALAAAEALRRALQASGAVICAPE